MKIPKTIIIKNIYYMLSYAFQALNEKEYKKIEVESFDNSEELFSEILAIGVSKQIKQGIIKDYKDFNENTSSIKGKIGIAESINSLSFIKGQLNCTYDEFSANCYLNQILKTTMNLLLKSVKSNKRKKKLKKLLLYFQEVDIIDINSINWKIRFDRNNQTYKMLINICYLVIYGLVQNENKGSTKLMTFDDEQVMSHLYEKFVLNYYKKEYPQLKPKSRTIKWQIDKGWDLMVPDMITDVTLVSDEKILIIDTKFYKYNTTKDDKHHTHNLYQIFAYVKNKEVELQGKPHEVSGMLLYARTDKNTQPDSKYWMSGNKISVKTLNLNQEFNLIKKELDDIVFDYF